jgi:hypothetical protein
VKENLAVVLAAIVVAGKDEAATLTEGAVVVVVRTDVQGRQGA